MRKLETVKDSELVFVSYEELKDVCLNVLYPGIWVQSDKHPCGWDFIELTDGFEHGWEIDIGNISDGCYDIHELEGLSVKEILKKVKVFWVNGAPEESYVPDGKYGYAWNGK